MEENSLQYEQKRLNSLQQEQIQHSTSLGESIQIMAFTGLRSQSFPILTRSIIMNPVITKENKTGIAAPHKICLGFFLNEHNGNDQSRRYI